MSHWSQGAKGTPNLTINKEKVSGKTVFVLFKEKNLKTSDSQKHSHQINLDPLDHQELQTPLTQRLFFTAYIQE